jgi:hypothetical protein
MKNILFAAVLLLTFSTIACGGSLPRIPIDPQPTPAATPSPSPSPTPVDRAGTVFVGDSLFGRMNLDAYFPGKGYINAGWFGKRTDEILAVFPQILNGSNVCHGYQNGNDPNWPFSCSSIKPPAQIVLLIGWNDLTQATSPTTAANNIKQMLILAKAAGVKIFVCVPYEWDSAMPASWMQTWPACSDNYAYSNSLPVLINGIEQAGVAESVPIINLQWLFRTGALTGGQCESGYTIDGLHPNDYGYWQIAAFIAATIN